MTPSQFVRVWRWPRRQVYAACASLTASRRNEGPRSCCQAESDWGAVKERLSASPSLRGDVRFQQRPERKIPPV